MSDVVISVDDVSKRYLIGHQSTERQSYAALRDVMAREARNFVRKAGDFFRGRQIVQGDQVEEFWALRHVNFQVRQGEVVGIIGRNGAGKSTLLKILSRITEPTEGRIRLRGRVASLLEVGTGFHGELTGRENIYLNGAILGMSRGEIRRKFDEIVAFAEIDAFLDTPVKRYSSGMYVRLAFAVAAHLEPEILVVDEVLAVGDAEFQKKCLGKMQDVANTYGRTVLFVSHNIAAVESLCTRALLLESGRAAAFGDTATVVQDYLRSLRRASVTPLQDRGDRQGRGEARFVSVALEHADGAAASAFQSGGTAVFHFVVENRAGRELKGLQVALAIDNEFGQQLAAFDTVLKDQGVARLGDGRTSVRAVCLRMPFIPGRYYMTAQLTLNGVVADRVKQAVAFDVEPGDYYGTGRFPHAGQCMFLADFDFVVGDLPDAARRPRVSGVKTT